MRKVFLLIDGNSILYRAFYAIPSLETSTNIPTNGLLGFLNILLNIIDTYKPDYVVVCFDTKAKTFRKAQYEEYKAQRAELPSSLAQQINLLKEEVLKPLSIPYLEKDGYEADDIIATLSNISFNKGFKTLILTGDRDLLQLVKDDLISVIAPVKGVSEVTYFNEEKVIEEYGVDPTQFVYYKALIGDSSDNIKGVPGIGPKSAVKLLKDYNCISSALNSSDKISIKLKENEALIKSNISLIKLNENVPIEIDIEKLKFNGISKDSLINVSKKFEFNSILKRITKEKFNEDKPNLKQINNFEDILKEKAISIIPLTKNTLEISTFKESFEFNIDSNSENLFDSNKDKILNILRNDKILKIAYDLKEILHRLDAPLYFKSKNTYDAQIAYFLLKPNSKSYDINNFLLDYSGSFEGDKGRAVLNCFDELKNDLINLEEYDLFESLEMPLLYVLYDMEKAGFKVSREVLINLKNRLSNEINLVKESIFKESNTEFNISSPKQLSFVLFEKLNLPYNKKKTKTGYSTGAEVLEELYNAHPIIPLIIKYRELTKSLNTYVEPFLSLLSDSSFIHTTFVQAGPATGRISSINPNLQNLPTGEDLGKEIRRAFIARDKSRVILSADYSQIDLRVLAHFSKDPSLVQAFSEGADIHSRTAKLIFGLNNDSEITPQMRRIAKTVNFGIIYGMSPFGLARALKIPDSEAETFIEKYFKTLPKVKEFINDAVSLALNNGYSETILGRKRSIHELKSENKTVRQLGERLAVNSVIQGSSADIIKAAMIKIAERLKGSNIYLILQIHDELIFDCPENKVGELSSMLREEMENVFNPINGQKLLSVPLKVSISYGPNLGELNFTSPHLSS